MLLVCLTKDGSWLQFASVAPHLYFALMKALGLDWMFTDDEWTGLPVLEGRPEKRRSCGRRCSRRPRTKTLAEWNDVFDADPNVFAEQFRNGPVALEHPQLLHDGFTVDVDGRGTGYGAPAGGHRQGRRYAGRPHDGARRRSTQHRDEILALAGRGRDIACAGVSTTDDLPLAGVTVLELATLFAAPHGTTMLTDLGAEVIKVEPIAGDRIRMILPFPEAGGFKVMQGKSSIAIDLTTPEGVAIIRRIAATADVVVQGYRAGAMAKLGTRLPIGEVHESRCGLRERTGVRRRRPVRREARVRAEHRGRLRDSARQRRGDGRRTRRPDDGADPGRCAPACRRRVRRRTHRPMVSPRSASRRRSCSA